MQGHNGESREERLSEILIVNADVVYALSEGVALRIRDNHAHVLGKTAILRFTGNLPPESIAAHSTFNY